MRERRRVESERQRWVEPLLAIAAALAFALSVPVSKLLLRDTSQLAVAGLLYLGAGLALTLYRLVSRATRHRGNTQVQMADMGVTERDASDWAWLAAATLCGAVAAPLILLWGLKMTPGATASLLLSFEAVFTALWAAGLFKEHVAAQVWWAVLAVTAGGVLLGLEGGGNWGVSLGALAVVGGCALWGLDNNLTRNIATLEPSRVAQLKSLAAGAVNLLLLLAVGGSLPRWPEVLFALVVGGLSYGVSLVLFVQALRYLGSARTSAYFGAGPFFAAAISLAIARSYPTLPLLAAAVLMLVGTVLMISEQHVHEHEHKGLAHAHWHLPDAEHRHGH
ncbi:MAG: DMT family transporter [Actinobacteria bacterium]|nr:DMT family transporter [Actinomycetota bacterium]